MHTCTAIGRAFYITSIKTSNLGDEEEESRLMANKQPRRSSTVVRDWKQFRAKVPSSVSLSWEGTPEDERRVDDAQKKRGAEGATSVSGKSGHISGDVRKFFSISSLSVVAFSTPI